MQPNGTDPNQAPSYNSRFSAWASPYSSYQSSATASTSYAVPPQFAFPWGTPYFGTAPSYANSYGQPIFGQQPPLSQAFFNSPYQSIYGSQYSQPAVNTNPRPFRPPSPPTQSSGYFQTARRSKTPATVPSASTSTSTSNSLRAPTASRAVSATTSTSEHSATGPDSPPCLEQTKDQGRLSTAHLSKKKKQQKMSHPEYANVLRDLSGMTVDRLKATIKLINDTFMYKKLVTSGLKHDLASRDSYLRLRTEIENVYDQQNYNFGLIVSIICQVLPGGFTARNRTLESGSTSRPPPAAPTAPAATTGHRPATTGYVTPHYQPRASASGYQPPSRHQAPPASAYGPAGGAASAGTAAGSRYSGMGGMAAVTNPALGGGGTSGSVVNRWQNDEVPIKFRPSPFYRVEKSLSPPVTLFKAEQGDRKVGCLSFGLTEVQRTLINRARESPSNPQYEVRLYCTSDNNYSIGRPHASQFPAPIEFPQICEIKLNNVLVNANTKGIKKQPGTTPPVNLSSKKGPSVMTAPGQLNRVEVAYSNTDRTTYYMVAYLVETTPLKKVVEKVKAGRTKAKEEVIQSIVDINKDEEIAASSFSVSLRDPLSFARIGIPVRSKLCNHISCFDAETWFEMNEQTPTWNCPICSKTLKPEDMVVDGFMEDILKTCSSSVDKVEVNPDGTWRSDDNKYGTAPARPNKGLIVPGGGSGTGTSGIHNSPRQDLSREGSVKPDISGINSSNKGKAKVDALTLDSDSEDDDQPLAKKPRLANPNGGTYHSAGGSASPFMNGAGTNGVRNGRGASEVLDLTLSDSDEEPTAPAPRTTFTNPIRTTTNPYVASASMARNGSRTGSGTGPPANGDPRTVEEIRKGVNDMNERMQKEFGADWRTKFSL
ncbi:uncharacterized protein JCM15063_003737 [Sporobolomyces koalae]|uniref:uncharacterized protein n=1 Tax=Sporobolomyces koalae TaxID=500713 RepID=UPI00317ACEFF